MQALTVAGKLDWGGWLTGLIRAFISGGSSAIVSGAGAMGIAPDRFNLTNSVGNTLKLAGFMFLFQGGYRLFEYLQLHAVPDPYVVQQQLANAKEAAKENVAAAKKVEGAVSDAKDSMSPKE